MNAEIQPIRILAVDDHPLVRQGIAGLIRIQPDMTLVGEASDGREAECPARFVPVEKRHWNKERVWEVGRSTNLSR